MDTVITLNKVGKKLGAFSLDSISFDINAGEIIGLLGKNGAGKTTTLKAILNLINIDTGDIKVLDKSNKEIDYGQVGVVFEECNYFNNFTIIELEKIQEKLFKGWNTNIYNSLVKDFDLPNKKQIKNIVEELSNKAVADYKSLLGVATTN